MRSIFVIGKSAFMSKKGNMCFIVRFACDSDDNGGYRNVFTSFVEKDIYDSLVPLIEQDAKLYIDYANNKAVILSA